MHGRASQWLPVICHGTVGGGSCVTGYVYSDGESWNDNVRRPSHIHHTVHGAKLHLPVRHSIRSRALGAALVVFSFHRAAAQATTSLETDATVLNRHGFDVRLLTSWTRFDEFLGNGGKRNIGSSFVVDSLTGDLIPGLPLNGLVAAATNNPNLRVTAGATTGGANARIVTAPLMLEYGLSRRLTIGVVVPLVETRTTVLVGLNQKPGAANVGLNPAILTSSWTQNAALIKSLQDAASGLQNQLKSCQSNSSGPGCTTILSQQSAVQTLIASTQSFASATGLIYGTGESAPGTTFVPIGGSDIQKAIDARLAALVASYQVFNGPVPTGKFATAEIPANNALNAVLQGAGYDTLQSPSRSSIGDISVGASYQLSNSFPDTAVAPGFHERIAVNVTGRFGTGEPADRDRLFDNATGYGQPGLILGGATDFAWGDRWAFSALGSYTMQFGSVNVSRVPNTAYAALPLTAALGGTYTAGNVLSLTAIPRFRLGGYVSLNGYYAFTRVGADQYTAPNVGPPPPGSATQSVLIPVATPPFGNDAATLQQVGIGFSYSTSQTLRGPGRIPFEANFRHLETLSVSGGPAPKTFQDQVGLRVFVR